VIDAQAYILRERGSVPQLEDIKVSEDLSRGQVLVRVIYSALCATQMEEIYVSGRNSKFMPHLFGHEGVGVIEQVGPDVTHRKVGETCVIHWRESSLGLDASPGIYSSGPNLVNSGKTVTFSTHIVVPENRLTLAPAKIPLHLAPLFGCSLSTGWGSLAKVGLFSPPEPVIVTGLGAVGSFAALSAKLLGSKYVIGIDPKSSIADSWRERGLDAFAESIEAALEQLDLVHCLPELIIETSGDPDVIEKLSALAGRSSRLILVGMPKEGIRPRVDAQNLLDGLTLKGSNGGSVDPALDFQIISKLFSQTLNNMGSDAVKTLRLNELDQAVREFRSGNHLRIVLSMAPN